MKGLIIEDEYRLADLIRDRLEKEGFDTEIATNGEDGYLQAREGIYDILILDVMLPDMNGFEILKRLREEGCTSQILMLTAKSELESKIAGLDGGAEDYMTKPFEMEELMARIRVLTRRKCQSSPEQSGGLRFGDICLDTRRHELTCEHGSQTMKLADKEYRLLEYFLMNGEQVLSKEQISLRIWGYEADVEYNSAEVYVSFLRKKLTFLHSTVKIQTIRGVGYQLTRGEA